MELELYHTITVSGGLQYISRTELLHRHLQTGLSQLVSSLSHFSGFNSSLTRSQHLALSTKLLSELLLLITTGIPSIQLCNCHGRSKPSNRRAVSSDSQAYTNEKLAHWTQSWPILTSIVVLFHRKNLTGAASLTSQHPNNSKGVIAARALRSEPY